METLQAEKKIQMNSEFQTQLNWEEIQNKLFPAGAPRTKDWTDLEDIIYVLNVIASTSENNQMFYPTGGADEIRSACRSTEPGCIEIVTDDHVEILSPKRLLFCSFEEDSDYNFFRLELNNIEPSGVYGSSNESSEELIKYDNGEYENIGFWAENEVNGQQIPEDSQMVTRHLRGSFVIFSEISPYNVSDTYDARHNSMNELEFHTYIKNSIKSRIAS